MRKAVIGTAIVVMACVAVVQAAVLTIQDQTTGGTDPNVQDSLLMPELTAYTGAEADGNYGAEQTLRFYPDTASSYGDSTKYGPRHLVFKFATSFFDAVPDPQVTSAKLRFYVHPRNNTSSTNAAYTDMKLSRFSDGKDWIEGTGAFDRVPGGFTPQPGAAALDGEVTWNSQKHSLNPAWATAGATDATDIDMFSTKTFTISASAHVGELRLVEIDVTDFVQAWASGTAENNGMNLWGGSTGTVGAAINWNAIMSENLGGETWWVNQSGTWTQITTDISYRPSLVVDYTPEPASVLVLALGMLPMLRRRR